MPAAAMGWHPSRRRETDPGGFGMLTLGVSVMGRVEAGAIAFVLGP